jgi:hypothetical protein
VASQRAGLSWAEDTQVGTYLVDCGLEKHRVNLDPRSGLYFDDHYCESSLLNIEAALLGTELDTCQLLASWWERRLGVRAVETRWEEGIVVLFFFGRVAPPGKPLPAGAVSLHSEEKDLILLRRVINSTEEGATTLFSVERKRRRPR